MYRLLLCTLLAAMVAAATACADSEHATVEVTRIIEVPQTVEVTRIVEQSVPETVEVTRVIQEVVTATPPPPTATPEQQDKQAVAKNYVAVQDSGGVEIELVRVLFGDKAWLEEEMDASFADCSSEFENVDTVGEFILRVTNNTDEVITIYPDQGDVVIEDVQTSLDEYWCALGNLEDISGDLQPGVMRVGGFWFGVRRKQWDKIGEMIYLVDAPFDADWDDLGEDYRFEIDMSDAGFEPIPEDL
jgi:hypothetical protein